VSGGGGGSAGVCGGDLDWEFVKEFVIGRFVICD
jgi:hypothetical protein